MAGARRGGTLTHSIARWTWFDRQVIDPMDVEQLARIGAMLGVDPTEVYAAIKHVGPRAGDIRRYLHEVRPAR